MFEFSENREKDIKNMVELLQKMDDTGRTLMLRDANTLLMRQELEKEKNKKTA